LGTAGETTDRQVRLIGTTGGGTLEQAGGGLLKFTTALAAPGTAAADNRKTLTLAGSSAGTGEFAGAIVDSALGTAGQLATSVAKTGTGTWTLSGANTYTGTTTAGGGNLVLNFAAATAPATATNLVAAASPLAFSGGTLTVNGSAATATSQIFASTALNLGGGSIGLVNNGPGTVVNLGAITRATGGSLDILQPTGALSATNGVTTTTANNAAGILGGYATVGGTDWAVSGGSATNPVTAYSGYTTLTASGGGTQTTTNFLQVGAQALTAAVTANSLKITDTTTGAALDVGANNVTLNGAAGGLLYVPGAAGNSYTVSGTGTVGAGAANEFVVSVAAGGTLSISAPIIGAGAGGLTKTGPGTLVLSNAANAYTGPINVVGGVLSAAVANQNNPTTETASILGAAGARTITLNNGGTFQLTGANVLNPKAATKAFAIGSGGGTFDIPTAGGQITLDDGGQFAGTGPLTVTGAGVVFLDNQAFGFSGNVNVNGGTLRLARNSVLGTAPGRTLTVAGTGAVLDLNNAALILPLNVVLNGTGISNAGALIGTATVNLASGVTLATDSSVGGTNTLTLSGGVSGPGKLTKVGTNTVVLSGVNSYTGGTVASAGTLQAVRPFALPGYATAGQVSVAAGATLALNVGGFGEFAAADVTSALTSAAFTANATFALDTTNAAGGTFAAPAIAPSTAAVNFTKLGTGTLSLTAAGTYTGTTTILNGTVAVASGTNNTLNNGPLVLGSVGGANNALDLGATSQAFTTLRVNNSSATTGTSTITVAAGQTLSFSGNVLIGPDAPSATLPSRLNITGGGALAVATAAGGLFQVGGTNASTTTGQVLDNATLDLTGLGSVNINVSATGTVRVNNAMNANTAGVQSTLLMPTPAVPAGTAVTTILANNLNVGDNGSNGNGAGQVNALVLGTGLTTLNVNNLNVGTGGRDLGTLTFANANGTLTLQGAASTPTSRTRAAVNVGTGGASTGVAPGTGVTNVVDLSGHDADLFVSTLTIGSQNRNTDRTDTVTFNTGTLNATGVVI
ncbi:MAG TPA: autotransporter-associated beta strand repeat-containing protein, partial [Humisphaera sp.]